MGAVEEVVVGADDVDLFLESEKSDGTACEEEGDGVVGVLRSSSISPSSFS